MPPIVDAAEGSDRILLPPGDHVRRAGRDHLIASRASVVLGGGGIAHCADQPLAVRVLLGANTDVSDGCQRLQRRVVGPWLALCTTTTPGPVATRHGVSVPEPAPYEHAMWRTRPEFVAGQAACHRLWRKSCAGVAPDRGRLHRRGP